MAKNKINNHTVLLVKKAEAQKGKLWNDLADQRIIKQHGGYDIPENDAHAVRKYPDPIVTKKLTPEEEQAAFDSLSKKIEQLQEKEKNPQEATHASSENVHG